MATTTNEPVTELDRLRQENEHLRTRLSLKNAYIRSKVNELLDVMGTKPLRAEELDDDMLLEMDPLGIIFNSIRHVLANLKETNAQLHLLSEETAAIFEGADVGIMVLDSDYRIQSYNTKMKELFFQDKEEAEIKGENCFHLLCLESGPPELCVCSNVLRSEGVSRIMADPPADRPPLARTARAAGAGRDRRFRPFPPNRAKGSAGIMNTRIEIIDTPDALARLAGPWRRLWQRGDADVFQSHEWLHAWAKAAYPDVRLRIGVAWEGDRLLAALPMAIRWHKCVRRLEWAAQDPSDYCDALVAADCGPAVLPELLVGNSADWRLRRHSPFAGTSGCDRTNAA